MVRRYATTVDRLPVRTEYSHSGETDLEAARNDKGRHISVCTRRGLSDENSEPMVADHLNDGLSGADSTAIDEEYRIGPKARGGGSYGPSSPVITRNSGRPHQRDLEERRVYSLSVKCAVTTLKAVFVG